MSTWSHTSYAGAETNEFPDGMKNEWYEGEGKFTFPNGVVYDGQFRKGEFHGEGALVYPNGGRYQATWERGYAIEGRYIFNDGLLYEDRNWQYISQGDRRFYTEVLDGLQPAGKTLLTNEREPPKIPKGTYDTGNGYYDPATKLIMSYDGTSVIDQQLDEQWILNHCRKGFDGDDDEEAPTQEEHEEEGAGPGNPEPDWDAADAILGSSASSFGAD